MHLSMLYSVKVLVNHSEKWYKHLQNSARFVKRTVLGLMDASQRRQLTFNRNTIHCLTWIDYLSVSHRLGPRLTLSDLTTG